jgi:DegV family protein with EDD domain
MHGMERGRFMTNKRIAFVTDSTAYLSEELKQHPDIYIVPIVIISEGKEYEDGINLTSNELYELIRNEKEVPKTSQPNVNKFSNLYKDLMEAYDQIIAIHVSSKLSGTISSSSTAKNQERVPVEIVDSYSLSFAITTLLEKGLELARKGMDASTIASELRQMSAGHENLILLDTLEQLYKGGRMTGVQFKVGSFLQIKPILSISKSGELGLVERIRSEKKAIRRIVAMIKDSCEKSAVTRIGIMHGNALDKAIQLKEMIQAELPNLDIIIGEVSSSLAVHAGEGALAVFWSTSKS